MLVTIIREVAPIKKVLIELNATEARDIMNYRYGTMLPAPISGLVEIISKSLQEDK